MEIVSERTIEQENSPQVIVAIEVLFEYRNSDISLDLINLLGFLSQFYTANDNVLINLQVTSSELFPSWLWEKAVYVARRSTNFPVPVFVTQGTGVQENYLKNNRTLKIFRRAIGEPSTSSDESEDYNDGCDYETTLKLTLLHFAQLNGVSEDSLEDMLQKCRCLEEILSYVKW